MTNYTVNDVVIARFRQVTGPRYKTRPVMVVLDIADDDLVVAPITSVQRRGTGDLPLVQWRQAGLSVPSVVRLAKPTLIPKRSVLRGLGRLAAMDRRQVSETWQSLYRFAP
jgi:mRNA-degrading endonuclease toxin of MazEF toxin-antitoxin module